MMKTIRKTAIVMLLCVYFLTYGVLPQVEAGKDTPVSWWHTGQECKGGPGEYARSTGAGNP